MAKFDRTDLLIIYYLKRIGTPITRTRLLKLLYLADYYSHQWLGGAMSSMDWEFYRHGPFDRSIYDHTDHCAELVTEELHVTNNDEESWLYSLKNDPPAMAFTEDESMILDNVVEMTKPMSLKQLLDFVYKTEPMKELLEKGARPHQRETLNMRSLNNTAKRKTGVNLSYLRKSQEQIREGQFRELA